MPDEPALPDTQTLDLAQVESAVLRRLIEEVRQEQETPRAYDRIHNRHNRGPGPGPYPPPPAPPPPEEDAP